MIILALLLAFPCLLNAQFSLDIKIPKTVIGIEEHLEVQASFIFPEDYIVDMNTVRINLLKYVGLFEPPFSLQEETLTEVPGGLNAVFKLEPHMAGVHFISLYNVPFLSKKGGDKVELISDIFPIETLVVQHDAGHKGDPFPLLSLIERHPITLDSANRKTLLENPLRLAKESKESLALMRSKTLPWEKILALLACLIFYSILRLQPAKPRDLQKEQQARAAAAKKKALEGLLVAQKHADVILLANVLRAYIEEKFAIKATKQTTPEFLHAMAYSPAFDQETQTNLSAFLTSADKVKFADQHPEPEELKEAYALAETFIQQ